jgi:hypothetical protein
MPGSARWLMPHAVCHVAASGLRLSGEQKCMRIGPDHIRPGLDTCQLRTPAWNLGTLLWAARTPYGGWSGSHSRVRSVHVRVLDQLGGLDCISKVPALSHRGPDSLLMPWSISLSLDMWRPRSHLRGGVRCCCWLRVVARDWASHGLVPCTAPLPRD